MSRIAITRAVSDGVNACELTFAERVPIDVEVARAQHHEYEAVVANAGYDIVRLDGGPGMPDSVFVEDMAVVFDELAIVTRPGAESRRLETPAIVEAVRRYRRLETIVAPGIVDGGDVLTVGRAVFVGRSTRTNDAAIAQMRTILGPLGYTVRGVEVSGCLHLKSAVTALADDVVLVNPAWIDAAVFGAFTRVEIDPREPHAANALRLHDRIVFPSAFPRTAGRIVSRGFRVETVDASELAKAEGAVTCCSLIVEE